MRLTRQTGINLVWVSILSMIVAAAGMMALYTMRYGHLPFQEALARWQSSGKVIGNELQQATGIKDLNLPDQENAGAPPPVTVESGVRRCIIQGRTVFSDTECSDQNPTTKTMKLTDTKGFVHSKPVQTEDENATGTDTDLRRKMIDKVIEKSSR